MQKRSEIPLEDRWKVEDLYPSLQDWEKEYKTLIPQPTTPRFPQVSEWKGKLCQGPAVVLSALKSILELTRKLERLYIYALLRHYEDITDESCKIAYNQILSAVQDLHEETSYFDPELIALPQANIDSLLSDSSLKDYRFYLEKIVRMKPHRLAPSEELLVAQAEKALQTSAKAFFAINDADLQFGTAQDSKGKEHPLTHASYNSLLQSHDRTLRKSTYQNYHKAFHAFQNTLTELISGQVESHLFYARAHRFPSCLEAALFPYNIDVAVYHSLLEAVHEGIGALHHYIALRKKVMRVDKLHLWDMNVPLTQEIEMKMSYEEAVEAVIASVAPLGNAYQSQLANGLKEYRWVDRYENKGKRSGAISFSSYDGQPYILLNYKGTLRDAFILAHEAGHSMHSLLSNTHQPFHYAEYSNFLAEVASIFNEDLLTRYLLENAKSVQEKIYLINQKIEDIIATFFQTTLSAEFELRLHQFAEDGVSITPQALNDVYHTLNQTYYGPTVTIDPVGDIEWARIPHFYFNFYIFQYATGISAALTLAENLVHGGERERQAYLTLLKAGDSKYPIDLLKAAGIDMRAKTPVEATLKKFKSLVTTLEALIDTGSLTS
jgi:oligoendopeptidase F